MAASETPTDGPRTPRPQGAPYYRPWAQLLARTFAVDVLAGPRCDGRMRLLANVEDPANVARYLAGAGEATEVPPRSPGRGPPYWKSRVLRRQAFGKKEDHALTGGRTGRLFGGGVGIVGGEIKRATGFDVTIHDLRRTTASGLQRIGAPPHIISIVLGHNREAGAAKTDAAYTHDRREGEHRLWLERWAQHVGVLVRGERKGTVTTFPMVAGS